MKENCGKKEGICKLVSRIKKAYCIHCKKKIEGYIQMVTIGTNTYANEWAVPRICPKCKKPLYHL